jgi:6,7-dimethyl-8-ribityllumazine synthase
MFRAFRNSRAAMPHFLIIDARFYPELADELVKGASAELERLGATFERMSVPGVLEVPALLSMVIEADKGDDFDGFVLLGCVIRGETSHYDIVANESARALMDMTVDLGLALGNGILTVENGEQAWARARVTEKNKGGAAASAAWQMAALRRQLGLER